MAVNPLPAGYPVVIPYLLTSHADGLVAFIEQALGGTLHEASRLDDGSIRHAELRLGDSMVMVGQAAGERPPMPTMLYHYVTDVDAVYQRCLAAGAESLAPPSDMWYGDRVAGVRDAWANQWWLSTHIEDVSGEELARRWQSQRDQEAAG